MLEIIHQNNIDFLNNAQSNKYNLIYIDPPYNTGKKQEIHGISYNDKFENFMDFIVPRMKQAHRILADNGSFFFHIDYREVHYCKIELDKIFGRENFINNIIWSYDYGARQKNKWACKHDDILWYVKNKNDYIFNYDNIDRIPYMAPSLVGAEKAERGKTPTDVWWNTIVPTNGKERVGYPTQKPLKILERIVLVHSNENDLCLDFFAGSGSFGEACLNHNRNVVLVDESEHAINIMKKRLEKHLT